MRIGLDAHMLPYEQKEGLGYYGYYFCKHLLALGGGNEYVLFYNLFLRGEMRRLLDLHEFPYATNAVLPIPGRLLVYAWTKLGRPRIDTLLGRVDIFHTLATFSLPPYHLLAPQSRGKRVVTIHDIFPLLFPDHAGTLYDLVAYERGLRETVRVADAIIMVSEAARRDIVNYTGVAIEKTHVIYPGISSEIRRMEDCPQRQEVLKRFGLDGPYLLTASRLDTHKNISNVVKAFTIVRRTRRLKLAIAGIPGNAAEEVFSLVEKSEFRRDIVYLGYVPHQDLAPLMSASSAFVFPSLSETFGFPNLEAMRCGVPVVTSDIPSLREVDGDAALFVDPSRPEEIATGIAKILDDDGFRLDLVKRGLERVKVFSWEEAAGKAKALYRTLLGGKGNG